MVTPHLVMWATAEPVVFDADDDASCLRVYRETVGVASYEELTRIVNKRHSDTPLSQVTGARLVRATWEDRFSELRGECESRPTV